METLDKHFRELTRAAFARHGFAQAELIGRWLEIVGEELSRVSEPERIKWPRGAGEGARKGGGTLVIRAAPGRGLELQHAAPLIIERINRFHGHGAISAIKIVQAATWRGSPPATRPTPQRTLCEQELAAMENNPLRAALERLGAGVAAARSSPQSK
jgi:hypothetical protein